MTITERDNIACDLRPDAQAFDEIQIRTVPRYKTSGLSGDEWRISAEARFYRKGRLIFTQQCRDVQTACGLLWGWYAAGIDEGKAYFAGDGLTCDQEGCHEPAAYRMKKKAAYCREGHKTAPIGGRLGSDGVYRHFCEAHKTRGDCGLDDADDNYEVTKITE